MKKPNKKLTEDPTRSSVTGKKILKQFTNFVKEGLNGNVPYYMREGGGASYITSAHNGNVQYYIRDREKG